MDDVLVDVAGGGEHVAQRRGALAETLAQGAALVHARADLPEAACELRARALADRPLGRERQRAEVERVRLDCLGDLLGALPGGRVSGGRVPIPSEWSIALAIQ